MKFLRRSISDDDSWRDGYRYFSRAEMRCKGGPSCDCKGQGLPKHSFMVSLEKVRRRVGPMPVSSGFRCPSYNRDVGGTASSAHTLGLAADISCSKLVAIKIIVWGYVYGFRGFGVQQKGHLGGRYIHLDKMKGSKRPAIWNY